MKRFIIILICSVVCVSAVQAQRKVRKETHKGDNNYGGQQYGKAEERYKKAIELYNEAETKDRKKEVKEEDKNKEAFFNLANTYYRQNRWDEAIKAYQDYNIIEADEARQSRSWSNIGNSYLHKAIEPKQEDPSKASSQKQPDKLPRMEDLNKSMDAYKNALRRNPLDDEARYNLAVVQKMIQDQKDNEGDGGGQDNQQKDQQKDQEEQQKDQQDKNENDQNDNQENQDKQDQNQDPQDQRNENQMSRESIEQILKALEQEEKETQARVQQQKANEQKRKNSQNRQQDKDW
ncbi:tetratricopeptide repeat protein [Dysgonomonas sp. 25]|uniref:tetratricopeptide repeat protein n=1 Tax=Dysgonomonas sp. 25 TaxID=2302933 RepID=UPI001C88C1DD|nr:tetratricopeptide repeat protein [Dysgonomonas sp. 25]